MLKNFLFWRWSTWRHKRPWMTCTSRMLLLIHDVIKLGKHDSSTVAYFRCPSTMLCEWIYSRLVCSSCLWWWRTFNPSLAPMRLRSSGIHKLLIISQGLMRSILKVLTASKASNELILTHDLLTKSPLFMLAIRYIIDKRTLHGVDVFH